MTNDYKARKMKRKNAVDEKKKETKKIKEIIEVIDNEETQSKEKRKYTKRMKKGEKIFVLVNILVILSIIGYYAYRTVHYYKIEHHVEANITLKDKITRIDNITYQGDGLYEKDNVYYFKGTDVNNYVYYSGRIFRIIDINDGIRMIEEDNITNLVWGMDSEYKESLIHTWLNNYLDTLKDYEYFLKTNTFCNSMIDVENYDCTDSVEEYIGLLGTNDYLLAGGKNSYLNNSTYFWTVNKDKDNKSLYINAEGSINNLSNDNENYFSYGVRPVITLKEEISYVDGNGSKNSPYIIEELGMALLKDNSVGSFVKYQDEMFKIINIDEEGISLIRKDSLNEEVTYNNIFNYLEKNYLNKFNKNDLVKVDVTTNEYNYDNKYNYIVDSKTSKYVTIPKIGDNFVNDNPNYWLNTIGNSKLGLYYIVDDNNKFFTDLKNNKHQVRPIIKLKNDIVVTSGTGMENDPLIVGEA